MDVLLFLYQNAIWFFGGLLTGLTSFGGNLFAIPLLTLAMSARDAILLGCLCGGVTILALTILYRRQLLWAETLCLGLATLPGVPLGVAFLQQAGPRLLMLAAGMSLVLFLFWQALSSRLHVAEKPVARWWCVPLGFAAGLMMGAVSMGGPPLVLYAYLRRWGKENTIGGTCLAALVAMLAVVPAQWEAGLYTPALLKTALSGALASVGGILASMPLVHRMKAALFRRLLLVMIALSALMLLVRGLLA